MLKPYVGDLRTVVDVTDGAFGVALIPHTLGVTTLSRLTPGRRVNLESDVLAKYTARLLSMPDSSDG